ncbi:MAG: FHA domain-containing protein, partial [Verrucomicrobiota bacterium]
GRGRGRTFPLFTGSNVIGRGPANAIVLDLGDDTIPWDSACNVYFDCDQEAHFLLAAGRTVDAFLNGEPSKNPIKLQGGEKLKIGSTQLQFVLFQGSYHQWVFPMPKA